MTTINLGKIKPLYKGTYAGGVTYRPLDFTLYAGNLYVCKATSTGNLPTNTAYFDPVASVNAASIHNTPSGSLSSTTVQAALNELDSEKVAKTDVIAIARGGTGATTASAAADAIGAFRRGTLLGTVSQSAGVPTGALIEQGSNANGTYVRFADGTQICTKSSPFTEGADLVWPYPAVFAAAPNYLSASSNHTNPRYYLVDTVMTGGGTYATLHRSTRSTGALVTDAFTMSCVAIGRWF